MVIKPTPWKVYGGRACAHTHTEPEKKSPEIPKEVNSTHSWTEKEWLCIWMFLESNEEKRREKNRIEAKKNAYTHTHIQSKENVKKHAENYLQWQWCNSDNEIRITTHWRKLNLHFFTINCKKRQTRKWQIFVRYEYETEVMVVVVLPSDHRNRRLLPRPYHSLLHNDDKNISVCPQENEWEKKIQQNGKNTLFHTEKNRREKKEKNNIV